MSVIDPWDFEVLDPLTGRWSGLVGVERSFGCNHPECQPAARRRYGGPKACSTARPDRPCLVEARCDCGVLHLADPLVRSVSTDQTGYTATCAVCLEARAAAEHAELAAAGKKFRDENPGFRRHGDNDDAKGFGPWFSDD